jgi:hypothetical protein
MCMEGLRKDTNNFGQKLPVFQAKIRTKYLRDTALGQPIHYKQHGEIEVKTN